MLVVCNTSSCVVVMFYCWVSGVWVCVVVCTWAQKATINFQRFQHFQHYCSVCSDHPRVHLSARAARDSDSYNESREVGVEVVLSRNSTRFQLVLSTRNLLRWMMNPIQFHLPESYCFSPHHGCQARLVSRMLGLQSQEDWYSFVEADAVRALATKGARGRIIWRSDIFVTGGPVNEIAKMVQITSITMVYQ